jgi:hypothetical protein
MRLRKMIDTFVRIFLLLLLNILTVFGWVQKPLFDLLVMGSSIQSSIQSRILLQNTKRIYRIIKIPTKNE